jgi:predicted Zn-dependent protease
MDSNQPLVEVLGQTAASSLRALRSYSREASGTVRVVVNPAWGSAIVHRSYCGHGMRAAGAFELPNFAIAEKILNALLPLKVHPCGHCFP